MHRLIVPRAAAPLLRRGTTSLTRTFTCHNEVRGAYANSDGSVWQNPSHQWKVTRRYQGHIKSVILDWAGTVLDCGVYSPAVVFIEVFKNEGVPISMEESRAPMGAHKKVHIRKFTQLESVCERWKAKKGAYPT